jgi:GNAT superfamily N-acetyltransferase|tara:strand:- start:254 stop:694 length:441 start_codon:yes stop_codon:yes gene_type:complete
MQITIRNLSEADFDEWQSLWRGYLDFYQTQLDDAVFKSSFTRMLTPERDTQNALVAEQDGRLVGLVHFIYHPHNWKIEDVCYLQDLFVDPNLRGGGIGRALINAVYAASDVRGVPTVYWLTQDFNHDARKLYDSIASLTPFIKYTR